MSIDRQFRLVFRAILPTLALSIASPSAAQTPPPAPPPRPAAYVPPAPAVRDKPGAAVPLFDLGLLITMRDYPAAAYRQGEQGSVSFKADVSVEGTVTRCTIIEGSGSPRLDSATCTLFTDRARFDPAIDADGHPVPGHYPGRVVWDLSRRSKGQMPGTITRTFEVDEEGRVSKCRIAKVKGSASAQFRPGPEPCRRALYEWNYDPEHPGRRQLVTEVETITVEPVVPTP